MISFIPECFQAESIANSIREIQMNAGEHSTEAASAHEIRMLVICITLSHGIRDDHH